MIVDGAHQSAGAVIECTDRTARMLIGIGKAVPHTEPDEKKQYAEPVQEPVRQKRRRK